VPKQTFSYDGLGRPLHRTRGNASWTTAWANGVGTEVNGDTGTVRATEYDARGRVVSRTFQPGAVYAGLDGPTAFTLAYDGFDAVVSVAEQRPSGTVNSVFSYDDAHFLAGVSRGADSMQFNAWPGGRRKFVTVQGKSVGTTFDGRGRLSSVSGDWGATNVAWAPGGAQLTDLSDARLSQHWSWNSRGLLESTSFGAETLIYGDYDSRGNPLAESRVGYPARAFTYDSADRLTAARELDGSTHVYAYNVDGSRKSETLTADAGVFVSTYSELTSPAQGIQIDTLDADGGVVTARYLNDAEGHLKQVTRGALVTNYIWDVDDRLVRVDAPDSLTSFSYDAYGIRRAAVTQSKPLPGSSVSRSWVWNGEEPIAEVPVGASTQLLANVGGFRIAQGGIRFGFDSIGSAVSAVDTFTTTANAWSAWGAPAAPPPLTSPSVGYAGGSFDSAVNANYFQQRWMDPVTGSFLSADPVGASAYVSRTNGIGPWSYGALSPMRFTDPDGRDFMPPRGYSSCEAKGSDAERSECVRSLNQQGEATLALGALGACAYVPGCLPLLGKLGLGATTAQWLAGIQGHRKDGSLLQHAPDPVTAALDGIADSAVNCRSRISEGDWFNGDCANTALILGVGARGAASALARTNTARSAVLGTRLALGRLEVSSAEESALATFSREALSPLETGTLTSAAPGTFSSLAGPTAGFKKVVDFEKWLASQRAMSNVGDAYAEMYGHGDFAGMGVESEAGWWGGSTTPTRVPDFIVGPGGPADTVAYQKLFARPSWRTAARQTVWQSAAPGSSTVTRQCPTCPTEVYRWDTNGRQGFDINHRPTWHSRKLSAYEEYIGTGKLPTRAEVIDLSHENIELQCVTCNRSNEFNDP
jgi:RHS repeat-associated protein